MSDISTFIETGHPLLPVDILDLPAVVEEMVAKEHRERIEGYKKLHQELAEKDAKKKAEEQAKKRAELAREAGLDPEQLEKLVVSKSGADPK